MFTKPRKGGWNIPNRDSKAQNKDQRSIVTACTNTYPIKDLRFQLIKNIIVQYKDET